MHREKLTEWALQPWQRVQERDIERARGGEWGCITFIIDAPCITRHKKTCHKKTCVEWQQQQKGLQQGHLQLQMCHKKESTTAATTIVILRRHLLINYELF